MLFGRVYEAKRINIDHFRMAGLKTFTLRELSILNEKELLKLDQACLANSWSKDQIKEKLHSSNSYMLEVFEVTRLVGAIICREMLDELWILRICTLREFRRDRFL